LPLGSLFTSYLSVEILALHPRNVKHSFKNIFASPRSRTIPRRGITFRDKKIIAKIFAFAAEARARRSQFSRRPVFFARRNRAGIREIARLQGAPKNSTVFRIPNTKQHQMDIKAARKPVLATERA
jgi:hypothetical protein